MLVEREGDAIALAKEIGACLAHGCNCFNTMGSGFAKQIKEQLPELAAIDARSAKGDSAKLGTYTKQKYPWGIGYNLYTQFFYSRTESMFRLAAFETALFDCIADCIYNGYDTLVMPAIGSGLGKGDWAIIRGSIEKMTPDNFTVIVSRFEP